VGTAPDARTDRREIPYDTRPQEPIALHLSLACNVGSHCSANLRLPFDLAQEEHLGLSWSHVLIVALVFVVTNVSLPSNFGIWSTPKQQGHGTLIS
jgi:hypothetical protein